MKTWQKETLQHILIILSFVVFSYIYFYPMLEGKVLRQMDKETANGVAHEANTYHKLEKRDIPWTNSLFGGMPTYHIGSSIKKNNVFLGILRSLNHTLPYGTVSALFLYMLGFYLLLLAFNINKWISALGGLAFALSSFNIIIIAAGHITQVYAIAFMPVVFAGFILIYKGKYWWGTLLAMLGFGIQMATTHIQIIYYTALSVGLYVIFAFFWKLKEKKLKDFGYATALSFLIVVLAILPNIMTIWETYEIGQYSIRGNGKNTVEEGKKKGLDKDYALAWSYGTGETWSLLIPNVKGGATGYIGENKNVMAKVPQQYRQIISQQNAYWGDQPFTSGPVYLGAIIVFLAVLGMFIIKDKIKWWLFTATIVAILLSWGKNFGLFTNLVFNYLPFYNKFRTVSMSLVIASVTVPMLAFLAIKEIMENPDEMKAKLKYLWISLGLTAGFALLFWLIPGFFHFLSKQESDYIPQLLKQAPTQAQQIKEVFSQLEQTRKLILKADAIRSFLYIILSAAALLFFILKKDQKVLAFTILGFLIVVDLFAVDRRYLGAKDFVSKSQAKAIFNPSPADKIIMKDVDPYYRVLNIAVNTFNDATTSYFHKSVGGYHAVKLQTYQDVIERYLAPYVQALQNGLKDSTFNSNTYLQSMPILNALNTKYIIYNPQAFPIVNNFAYGNAWFVDNYKYVETPKEELDAIGNTDLKRTAVIYKKINDVSKLPDLDIMGDSTRRIILTAYKPDILTFEEVSNKGGFVVFSDIYYPKGWIATIDGKPTTIYRTDYILRGIVVPAGKHTIKFVFKPDSVYVGKKIATAGSILVVVALLAIIYVLYKFYKNQKKKNE